MTANHHSHHHANIFVYTNRKSNGKSKQVERERQGQQNLAALKI